MLLLTMPMRPLVGALILICALAGCDRKTADQPAQAPEVGVFIVAASPLPVFSDLPGRTNASLVSQVRARVDGIVLQREFTEGDIVQAGQLLYKIDPAPYLAALDSARASLARAQAESKAQNSLVSRYKALVATNAISRQTYDNAVAAQGQASADVASARASVAIAQINLDYTNIVSPITGRIGISEITPGAFVRASDATLMATVLQLDPMYVDLTQSSVEGLGFRSEILDGSLSHPKERMTKVQLTLENGRTYSEEGKLQFADVSVDEGTGSVTVRTVFPNKNGLLLPGMFVRARLQQGINPAAMLVPQLGVTHDQGGRPTALVVGEGDTVAKAVLTTAGMHGADWIVTSGVKPGDRVIVQGIQKVRPGTFVRSVPAQLPTRATVDARDASSIKKVPSDS